MCCRDHEHRLRQGISDRTMRRCRSSARECILRCLIGRHHGIWPPPILGISNCRWRSTLPRSGATQHKKPVLH